MLLIGSVGRAEPLLMNIVLGRGKADLRESATQASRPAAESQTSTIHECCLSCQCATWEARGTKCAVHPRTAQWCACHIVELQSTGRHGEVCPKILRMVSTEGPSRQERLRRLAWYGEGEHQGNYNWASVGGIRSPEKVVGHQQLVRPVRMEDNTVQGILLPSTT